MSNMQKKKKKDVVIVLKYSLVNTLAMPLYVLCKIYHLKIEALSTI